MDPICSYYHILSVHSVLGNPLILSSLQCVPECTVGHGWGIFSHYNDVIMGAMASPITSLTIVFSTVYSGAEQRKHQSSASLDFVRGIHRGPVNSPHKGTVTRKMLPFYDVIMSLGIIRHLHISVWLKVNKTFPWHYIIFRKRKTYFKFKYKTIN